jgi:hypothetical protein
VTRRSVRLLEVQKSLQEGTADEENLTREVRTQTPSS